MLCTNAFGTWPKKEQLLGVKISGSSKGERSEAQKKPLICSDRRTPHVPSKTSFKAKASEQDPPGHRSRRVVIVAGELRLCGPWRTGNRLIDKKAQGKTCDAIIGITDEGTEIMKEYKGSPALDAGLIAAAQAVEHYEISRYGTLRTWAEELGLNDAVSLLQETLDEEKATDEVLTKIAESVVNREAEAA